MPLKGVKMSKEHKRKIGEANSKNVIGKLITTAGKLTEHLLSR